MAEKSKTPTPKPADSKVVNMVKPAPKAAEVPKVQTPILPAPPKQVALPKAEVKEVVHVPKAAPVAAQPKATSHQKPPLSQDWIRTWGDLADFAKFTQSMETNMTNMKTQMEQLTAETKALSQSGIQSIVQASTSLLCGYEAIVQEAAGLAQKAATAQTQYMQKAFGSQTLNDLANMSRTCAQETLDKAILGATKLTEMSLKTLSESTHPITTQISKTLKIVSKA